MRYRATILVGIPCSGKSTFAKTLSNTNNISRDMVRYVYWGKEYKYTYENEKEVSRIINGLFLEMVKENKDIVIDNTHCKEGYIDEWLIKIPMRFKIEIKRFEISLTKAYIRNIIRWAFTGKWIPFKVIKVMQENYNNINWKKYEKYLV